MLDKLKNSVHTGSPAPRLAPPHLAPPDPQHVHEGGHGPRAPRPGEDDGVPLPRPAGRPQDVPRLVPAGAVELGVFELFDDLTK